MLRIIADENIPFLKGVLEPYADIKYMSGRQISRDAVKKADAILVRTRTQCNESLLRNTSVRFIGTATIGFDHIDTEYCRMKGIKWVNAPGCNSSSVQQYVASALLRIASEHRFMLKNKTIGIVGVGNVGSKVASFAKIMGMRVLLNDPPRQRKEKNNEFSDLDTILRESDIITLHVPLTFEGQDKTFYFFNKDIFDNTKQGAWFINTSRGEVVNTEDLKKAISGEKLAGSVLDVWENEPELDIPLMHMSYLSTPHIAGYSTDGKANGTVIIVRELSNFFGLKLSSWTPERIPEPVSPSLIIDVNGKNTEEIVRRSVFHTYNIIEDDVKLRFDPSLFEKLRGNYPVRREFPAYTINLRGDNHEAAELLNKLGFRIKA